MSAEFARVYIPGDIWLDPADTLVASGEYTLEDLAQVMRMNRTYRHWTQPFYNPWRPAGMR